MWPLFLAVGLTWLSALVAQYALVYRLADEVEKDQPIEQRPSWALINRTTSWQLLRAHAQMYPERRRMRGWLLTVMVVQAMMIFVGFIGLVIFNLTRARG